MASKIAHHLSKTRILKYQIFPAEGGLDCSKKNHPTPLQGRWLVVFGSLQDGKKAVSYFKEVYTKDPTLIHDDVLDCIEHRVTDAMNDILYEKKSEKEVLYALFQIGPLKASGPDGFQRRFYQRNWVCLKLEIIIAVLIFFDTVHMPPEVNDTFILLSPKVDHPVDLKDFFPYQFMQFYI